MADLLLNIIGSDGASAAFRGVAASFQELTKLAADCTKQFEEQAKADRQLERYAGDLTGAFKAQATAMQEQLGVSDDMVEKMQTMLLRFGEAPDQVEATTRALLDYSAATGTDAVAATQTLLSSVNSGKAAFKDLGLVYDSTGHKSADLVAVTNALAGKVGGSAKAEAGSLSGQTRIAIEAMNEFKESVGGLISEFITKTGAVGTFTQAIRDLQVLLFGANEQALAGIQHNLDESTAKLAKWRDEAARGMTGDLLTGGHTREEIAALEADVLRLQKAWTDLDAKKRAAAIAGKPELPGLAPGEDERTTKGKKDAGKSAHKEETDEQKRFIEELNQNWEIRADDEAAARQKMATDRDAARVADLQRDSQELADDEKHFEERRKQIDRAVQYQLDVDEKRLKDEEKAQKKLSDQMVKEAKRTEELVMEAATAIGMAFANALGSALAEAMSGGEVDVVGLVADIGFSVAAIAASTIANIYAPGTGTLIGGLIGTAGSVVHGVRGRAWQQEQASRRKHHDGGWVGPDRYHSGGWPGLPGLATDEEPIIAQRGEAVLSRSDVQRMGGRSAVDRARRGGGDLHVTVVAQDTVSVREFFEDRGGRGFYNAIRTGRGVLTQAALGDG